MLDHKTAILCSGVALGVYIPALLMNYHLRQKGLDTRVHVLEDLIYGAKRNKINDNKIAFHKNFAAALLGQKMMRDIRPSLDMNLITDLFEVWKKSNMKNFIVFSGFWIPILEDYRAHIFPEKINVDLCHMDAGISASWKNVAMDDPSYRNIWLFNWEEKRLIHEIPVSRQPLIPYYQREDRIVIHGGGWGMGTYLSKVRELEERDLALNIVIYDMSEVDFEKKRNRYFMVDPKWSPWLTNETSEPEFPPFGEVKPAEQTNFANKQAYHELFDLIRSCKVIVSKPGGSTLLDSLASATPVVMLDPFGDYEMKNAKLWEYLDYGIFYDQWKEADFSFEILEKLHLNLLQAREQLIDYSDEYSQRRNNWALQK